MLDFILFFSGLFTYKFKYNISVLDVTVDEV